MTTGELYLIEDVRIDSVRICGQLIERPTRISREQWVLYWERRKG